MRSSHDTFFRRVGTSDDDLNSLDFSEDPLNISPGNDNYYLLSKHFNYYSELGKRLSRSEDSLDIVSVNRVSRVKYLFDQ